MATIGMRELANHASAVVDEVSRTGRPALVTKHGRPVAVLAAIDEEVLLDLVLANAPAYVCSMRTAEREIARGELGLLPDAPVTSKGPLGGIGSSRATAGTCRPRTRRSR